MRSFASVAAFASIALATVASALPAMGGSAGLSRRDGLGDAANTVSKVTTVAGSVNGLNGIVPSANTPQPRYAPSPSDGYHADLVTLVAQATGLTRVEILAQALAIVDLDVSHIDIKALLPFDLNIIAVVWHYAPWVTIETIVAQLGTTVELVKDAQLDIATAQTNQPTGGGSVKYRRDAPGPDVGSAVGGLGGVGALVGGLGKTKAARAEYRGVPDVLVEVRVKVQDLCHELSGRISAAASASIALDASLEILAEIKAHLVNARAEIEAIIGANVAGALCLNGKLLSVQAIAEIYAAIVVAICVTLQLVVKACAEVKTDILIALIADICVALAACITLGAKLAVGLVVDIRALIEVCVRIIVDLKLDVLIQLFKLGSGY